jgi:hypothetical protein
MLHAACCVLHAADKGPPVSPLRRPPSRPAVLGARLPSAHIVHGCTAWPCAAAADHTGFLKLRGVPFSATPDDRASAARAHACSTMLRRVVCCSVLYVAACCMLQRVVCCSVLYAAACCMVQRVVCCSVLYVAACCMLQRVVCCSVLYGATCWLYGAMHRLAARAPMSAHACWEWVHTGVVDWSTPVDTHSTERSVELCASLGGSCFLPDRPVPRVSAAVDVRSIAR